MDKFEVDYYKVISCFYMNHDGDIGDFIKKISLSDFKLSIDGSVEFLLDHTIDNIYRSKLKDTIIMGMNKEDMPKHLDYSHKYSYCHMTIPIYHLDEMILRRLKNNYANFKGMCYKVGYDRHRSVCSDGYVGLFTPLAYCLAIGLNKSINFIIGSKLETISYQLLTMKLGGRIVMDAMIFRELKRSIEIAYYNLDKLDRKWFLRWINKKRQHWGYARHMKFTEMMVDSLSGEQIDYTLIYGKNYAKILDNIRHLLAHYDDEYVSERLKNIKTESILDSFGDDFDAGLHPTLSKRFIKHMSKEEPDAGYLGIMFSIVSHYFITDVKFKEVFAKAICETRFHHEIEIIKKHISSVPTIIYNINNKKISKKIISHLFGNLLHRFKYHESIIDDIKRIFDYCYDVYPIREIAKDWLKVDIVFLKYIIDIPDSVVNIIKDYYII